MRIIILITSILFTLFERIVLSALLGELRVDVVLLFWITVLYVCFYGREQKDKAGDIVLPIFISGLLFDFLSGDIIGLHSLLFLSAGFIVLLLVKRIPFQNVLFLFPLNILVISLFYNLGLFIYFTFTGEIVSFSLFEFMLRTTIANLCGGLVIYPLGVFILKRTSFRGDVEIGA